MKRTLVLAVAMLWAAAPADAQLVNFPVFAVPSSGGMPATGIGLTYGRGLNADSGKQNAYGVSVARTGIAERINVIVGGALVDFDPDSKFTFGGNVGVDLLPSDGSVQIGVQGGMGYMSIDPLTYLYFPIGVSFSTTIQSESADIGLWAMPRLDYRRISASGSSDSNTDFGASAGFGVTLASGFGFHGALDLFAPGDANVWLGGIGIHYVIQ